MLEGRNTPGKWKDDITVLLYKKGDPGLVANHRPIGLKRSIYKLWTSVVTRILTDYIEEKGLLSKAQAGFRRQKRTHHQMQRLILALEDAKLSKSNTQVLYVDFVDAVGSVDHTRLHEIMGAMGIPQYAIDLINETYTRGQA